MGRHTVCPIWGLEFSLCLGCSSPLHLPGKSNECKSAGCLLERRQCVWPDSWRPSECVTAWGETWGEPPPKPKKQKRFAQSDERVYTNQAWQHLHVSCPCSCTSASVPAQLHHCSSCLPHASPLTAPPRHNFSNVVQREGGLWTGPPTASLHRGCVGEGSCSGSSSNTSSSTH